MAVGYAENKGQVLGQQTKQIYLLIFILIRRKRLKEFNKQEVKQKGLPKSLQFIYKICLSVTKHDCDAFMYRHTI